MKRDKISEIQHARLMRQADFTLQKLERRLERASKEMNRTKGKQASKFSMLAAREAQLTKLVRMAKNRLKRRENL